MSFEAELSTPPDWLSVSGRFDESCRIRLSDVTCDAIRGGALRLRVLQHGSASVIRRASLSLSATRGNIVIHLGSDDSTVSFGEQTLGAWDLRLWRESTVSIADNCSSNGARIVVDKSEVTLGADCMLSDTVLIQSADQHGIVDLLTGALINDRRRATAIGRHVWLGRRSTLMPDVTIGDGSIVGTGAVVTSDVPETSIAVGVPARVVRSDVSWSRSPSSLDRVAAEFVASHRSTGAGSAG